MLKVLLTIFSLLLLNVYGLEKAQQFSWSSCSGSNPAVSLSSLFVAPSPITHPGEANIAASGTINREINGKVRVELRVQRIVLGLGLTIQCINNNGVLIGSCTYEDACVDVLQGMGGLDPLNCPESVASVTNNCECPLNVPTGSFEEVFPLSVPDLSDSALSIFADGDYNVKITASDPQGELACLQTKFSLAKAAYIV